MKSKTGQRLTGKILFAGVIICQSPLLVGAGQGSDYIDSPVLRDSRGIPYIPASSLAGALRHYYYETCVEPGLADAAQADCFWGGASSSGVQSALIVKDAVAVNPASVKVTARDGIRIDNRYGVAEPKFKYNYELVERGAKFSIQFEINLREDGRYGKEGFLRILATILNALQQGHIRIGAMTTKGFGRCKLDEKASILRVLDFSRPQDVIAWLERDFSGITPIDLKALAPYLPRDNSFTIEADFALCSSFIIRTYPGNPNDPDAVPITSAGDPVLPGTSLKGALRARTLRIIRSVGLGREEQANHMLASLFGIADPAENIKIKSRLYIEESLFDKSKLVEDAHARIRIDRFTGGVIRGALFDSMPLWAVDGIDKAVSLKMTIRDYKRWEGGLLLLLLKDLWTGDLPIGGEKGIGRGVLRGLWGSISASGIKVTIQAREDGSLALKGEGIEQMEQLVREFVVASREAAHREVSI